MHLGMSEAKRSTQGLAVETTPPVDAKGAIIQVAQAHLSAHPVPVDGSEELGDR